MTRKRILIIVPIVIFLGFVGVYFLFPGTIVGLLQKAERNAGGLTQNSINVNGLRIEYLEGGKGEPLVLLHGFGADKDNWTRIAKYLTPHFRVIAPDLPGFGESGPDPDDVYTIGIQAKRVKAFIQALGIRAMHLGGSSMGGNIAGTYASIYPEDLKSLLLIAPHGVISSDSSEMDRLLSEGKPNPLLVKSSEDFEHLLDFLFETRPFIPQPIIKYLAQESIKHQPLNSKIFKQINNPVNSSSLEDLLEGSSVTTLIIWGSQDRLLHVSGARILDSVMLKAEVEIMDAVGHLPMIEKPEETSVLYLRFLKDNVK